MTTDLTAPDLSLRLAPLKAAERLRVLQSEFGTRVVATTSFGLQAAVMLHLIYHHAPEIPVVFIDTGYLFPETYQYIDTIMEKWPVNLRTYMPQFTPARQEALYGKLWELGKDGNDKYALINKIEPMNRALQELGADVWVSGLRRSQSSTRVHRPFAEQQKNPQGLSHPRLGRRASRRLHGIKRHPTTPLSRSIHHHGRLAQHPPRRTRRRSRIHPLQRPKIRMRPPRSFPNSDFQI